MNSHNNLFLWLFIHAVLFFFSFWGQGKKILYFIIDQTTTANYPINCSQNCTSSRPVWIKQSNSQITQILLFSIPQRQAEKQQGSLHQPGNQVAAAVLKERHKQVRKMSTLSFSPSGLEHH